MPRLFIFAIGGTGSRVLKSLTMLLAAGIKPKCENQYEIVPIIIDPHKSNEDLKRTLRALDCYQKIATETESSYSFFGTKITTLEKLVASENRLANTFTFNLQQVANTKFRDYIDYNNLDAANKAFANLLFSGKSINKHGSQVPLLDIEMDIGFVGNPNVGSVVLNQFKDSQEFREFASNFNQDDRIFIVSSIFGGTGAAGFPTILKNIRDARENQAIDGKGFLTDAKIGSLTVLPYFNIEKDQESPIQKSAFISKSRSALNYYSESVNNLVNAMYYLADDFSGKPYKNDPGDGGQRNDAHFIEFLGALSIVNFLEIPDDELVTQNGRPLSPVFKEFCLTNDSPEVIFKDFDAYTERIVAPPLSQFALFKKYIEDQLESSIEKQPWSVAESPRIDRSFTESSFFRVYLREFLDLFGQWLQEMETNRRAFKPFNSSSELSAVINGKNAKKSLFGSTIKYGDFDDELNKTSKGKSFPSPAAKLLGIFQEATNHLLVKKFEGFQN